MHAYAFTCTALICVTTLPDSDQSVSTLRLAAHKHSQLYSIQYLPGSGATGGLIAATAGSSNT